MGNPTEEIESPVAKIKENEVAEKEAEKSLNHIVSDFNKDINSLSEQLKIMKEHYSELLNINLSLEAGEKILLEREKQFLVIIKDLIEPLKTLTGFYSIMRHLPASLTEIEIKEFALRMDVSTKDILIKLQNLLTWSFVQKGNVKFNPQTLNLDQLIMENIAFFETTAQKKNITIHHNLAKEVYVKADREMINYIVKNLLSNAIKFSFRGGDIRILIKHVNKSVEIRIEDDGVGIGEEQLKNLFNNTFKRPTAGTNQEKGYGFGLDPCKGFVNKHHGNIFIKSFINEGTTVGFTLPLAMPKNLKKEIKNELAY